MSEVKLSILVGLIVACGFLPVAYKKSYYTPNYIEVMVEITDPPATWVPPKEIEESDLVSCHINIRNIVDIRPWRGYNRKTPRVLITMIGSRQNVVICDYEDLMDEIKKASAGIVAGN